MANIDGLHGGCEPRIEFVKGKQDVDGPGLDRETDTRSMPVSTAAEKFAWKGEKLAQQVETLEHPRVVGKQRIFVLESDLLQAFRRGLEDDGISEIVEIAEIDAPAMGKQLLVKRDRHPLQRQ